MAKFPEAEARIFRNVYICRKCKSKVRAPNLKVLSGKITCQKCGAHAFRPVKKK
ncbi:MAG: 50S ribosomal protein L40e [Nanoarchaeota archaeon]